MQLHGGATKLSCRLHPAFRHLSPTDENIKKEVQRLFDHMSRGPEGVSVTRDSVCDRYCDGDDCPTHLLKTGREYGNKEVCVNARTAKYLADMQASREGVLGRVLKDYVTQGQSICNLEDEERKRQKELARQQKQEAKRRKKEAKRGMRGGEIVDYVLPAFGVVFLVGSVLAVREYRKMNRG